MYWPDEWKRTRDRSRSKYQVPFAKARDELASSLKALTGDHTFGTSRFVLTSNVPTRVTDGLPLAGYGDPADPGVSVWWLARAGNEYQLRVMACDKWKSVRENVRALGLAVEALRGLERCGATQILDQAMRSFTIPALQEGKPWWVLELGLQDFPASVLEVDTFFKRQAQRKHPDKGGTHEGFLKLQNARELAIAHVYAKAGAR